MEVIVKGVHPNEEWCKGTCSRCKTQVKFQKKEAKHFDDQREGETWSVTCPTCSTTMWGSPTEWKKYVQETNSKIDPY